MSRFRAEKIDAAQAGLQEAIDASDLIGQWEYDVPNDRVYADALVALVFNLDPARAAAGASLDAFAAGVHPEDRERFTQEVKRSTETGLCSTFEYRVCSADGVVRWVLDRGRIMLDEAGRPARGRGVLIDVTHARLDEGASNPEATCAAQHPLERAAEHCLAARKAIDVLPEPLLHQISDLLLLEVGRTLSRLTDQSRRNAMN